MEEWGYYRIYNAGNKKWILNLENSNKIDRQDLSNPNRNTSHLELLKKAEVINLKDNHKIEYLEGGKIIVHVIDENKKF
jgi:hypothetical protein